VRDEYLPFDKRREYLQGEAGARIAKRILFDEWGWLSYDAPPISEPVDSFIVRIDASLQMPCEYKCYPRRYRYPDTGIDLSPRNNYKRLERASGELLVLFVDPRLGTVYGDFLSVLETKSEVVGWGGAMRQYPRMEEGATGWKVYYWLGAMREFGKMTDAELAEIRASCKSVSLLEPLCEIGWNRLDPPKDKKPPQLELVL
jgi:hypothetical protein